MSRFSTIIIPFLAFLFLGPSSSGASSGEASFHCQLSPAGSFMGRTQEVSGYAVALKDGSFEAKNIVVKLTNIKTGMKLRDQHTQKYLETQKFPEAALVSAHGKKGIGEGVIRVRGIEKPIKGTYEVSGSTLKAKFPMSLKEYNISGIRYMGVGVRDEIQIEVSVPIRRTN